MTLTTALLSDRMTNHRSNVFVKCWSSASVACVPHLQTLVSRLQQLGLWDHNYHYHTLWKISIKLTHEHMFQLTYSINPHAYRLIHQVKQSRILLRCYVATVSQRQLSSLMSNDYICNHIHNAINIAWHNAIHFSCKLFEINLR